MKKTEMISDLMERINSLGDALDVLGYSLEGMYYIDNDETTLRKMISQITGSLECLKCYHSQISEDIDKLYDEVIKDGEAPEENPKYREERLIWVYRHMDEDDKGRLDRYCDGFHLGFDHATE